MSTIYSLPRASTLPSAASLTLFQRATQFIARLIRSGGFYRPDGLLEGLAPIVAEQANGIVDLHLYTFNAVDMTERWRTAYLERLRVRSAA